MAAQIDYKSLIVPVGAAAFGLAYACSFIADVSRSNDGSRAGSNLRKILKNKNLDLNGAKTAIEELTRLVEADVRAKGSKGELEQISDNHLADVVELLQRLWKEKETISSPLLLNNISKLLIKLLDTPEARDAFARRGGVIRLLSFVAHLQQTVSVANHSIVVGLLQALDKATQVDKPLFYGDVPVGSQGALVVARYKYLFELVSTIEAADGDVRLPLSKVVLSVSSLKEGSARLQALNCLPILVMQLMKPAKGTQQNVRDAAAETLRNMVFLNSETCKALLSVDPNGNSMQAFCRLFSNPHPKNEKMYGMLIELFLTLLKKLPSSELKKLAAQVKETTLPEVFAELQTVDIDADLRLACGLVLVTMARLPEFKDLKQVLYDAEKQYAPAIQKRMAKDREIERLQRAKSQKQQQMQQQMMMQMMMGGGMPGMGGGEEDEESAMMKMAMMQQMMGGGAPEGY